MTKIKSLDDLKKMRDDLKSSISIRERSENPEELVQVKVAMATCAIASGSRNTMNYFVDELEKRNIEAVVTQTGCMGYCYAEPTVEITVPDKEPIVFGYVDEKKADEIIEKYIKGGELVEGIIPVNYENIDNKE
jgi:NADP-reducing hydrogenase subunit HndB